MSYRIDFSNQSRNFLKNIDKALARRLLEHINNLEVEPVPHDAKFIGRHEGDKVFRIRVGKHRILYKIKEIEKQVIITKIDKRSRVYQ